MTELPDLARVVRGLDGTGDDGTEVKGQEMLPEVMLKISQRTAYEFY
jgi:hypothetical protein